MTPSGSSWADVAAGGTLTQQSREVGEQSQAGGRQGEAQPAGLCGPEAGLHLREAVHTRGYTWVYSHMLSQGSLLLAQGLPLRVAVVEVRMGKRAWHELARSP